MDQFAGDDLHRVVSRIRSIADGLADHQDSVRAELGAIGQALAELAMENPLGAEHPTMLSPRATSEARRHGGQPMPVGGSFYVTSDGSVLMGVANSPSAIPKAIGVVTSLGGFLAAWASGEPVAFIGFAIVGFGIGALVQWWNGRGPVVSRFVAVPDAMSNTALAAMRSFVDRLEDSLPKA